MQTITNAPIQLSSAEQQAVKDIEQSLYNEIAQGACGKIDIYANIGFDLALCATFSVDTTRYYESDTNYFAYIVDSISLLDVYIAHADDTDKAMECTENNIYDALLEIEGIAGCSF